MAARRIVNRHSPVAVAMRQRSPLAPLPSSSRPHNPPGIDQLHQPVMCIIVGHDKERFSFFQVYRNRFLGLELGDGCILQTGNIRHEQPAPPPIHHSMGYCGTAAPQAPNTQRPAPNRQACQCRHTRLRMRRLRPVAVGCFFVSLPTLDSSHPDLCTT